VGLRLVFLGTPQFAVPTLEAIVEAGHTVEAVFTQPDRPKGRGNTLTASAVKQAALRLGLPVFQPERVRRLEVVAQLAAMKPDAMVVVGYGQIIPQSIIDIAPRGIINVHASLLPKYRGAAPIQWAIANGESRTGVTTMRIDAGLDTGEMLMKWETEIGVEENALELGLRLARAGAELLIETLRSDPKPEPQNDAEATLAPILKKEDGLIDWSWRADKIFNRARGFLPWPGAYTSFRGERFNLWRCRPGGVQGNRPGGLSYSDKRLYVGCGEGTTLELLEVQLEGRKRVSASDFLNGVHLTDNEVLGARN
jgi:methionyl-tRNA formyltransferase